MQAVGLQARGRIDCGGGPFPDRYGLASTG
jgi:hypothetical protein